jgi:hypothetical protein
MTKTAVGIKAHDRISDYENQAGRKALKRTDETRTKCLHKSPQRVSREAAKQYDPQESVDDLNLFAGRFGALQTFRVSGGAA